MGDKDLMFGLLICMLGGIIVLYSLMRIYFNKRKIDISDEVVILNVGGYIGQSTKAELEYALEIGKPVSYLEPLT